MSKYTDYEILLYCQPHLDKMWAAKITSIILNCDFRECKEYIKIYLEQKEPNEN